MQTSVLIQRDRLCVNAVHQDTLSVQTREIASVTTLYDFTAPKCTIIFATDIDECIASALTGFSACPEGEVCINNDGSFVCECPTGTTNSSGICKGMCNTKCVSEQSISHVVSM